MDPITLSTIMKIFSSISYSASKAGIVGMTKWLATKYAIENTNFNIISPAGVFNHQNKKFIKKYSELVPKQNGNTKTNLFGYRFFNF